MSFPQTIDELRTSGYKFEGESQCKKCEADIEWWTTPKGKKMPTNHGTAVPHWSTCEFADDFRSKSTPEPSTSKVTTATLNMDWLREQAKGCFCVVCKKISGRS